MFYPASVACKGPRERGGDVRLPRVPAGAASFEVNPAGDPQRSACTHFVRGELSRARRWRSL